MENGVWIATGDPSPTGSGSTLKEYSDDAETRRWGISDTEWFKARSNVLDTESDSDAGHDYFHVNGVVEFDFENSQASGFLDLLACVDSSCDQSDFERKWEASFSDASYETSQAWFDFSISGDTQASGASSVSFSNGDFVGFFVGEGADAISAGFNFGGEGSGSADDQFISGLALFEELDLFTDDDLGNIADSDSDGLFGLVLFDDNLEYTRGDSNDVEINNVIWGWTANPEEDESIEGLFVATNESTSESLTSNSGTTAIAFDRESIDDSFNLGLGFKFQEDDGLETLSDYDLVWGFWHDDDEDQFGVYDRYSVINQWAGIDTSGAAIYISAQPDYSGVALRSTGQFKAINWIGGRADGTEIEEVDGSFTLNLITGDFSSDGISICFGDDGCSTDDGQIWEINGFSSVSLNTDNARNRAVFDQLSVSGTITDRVEGSDSTPSDSSFNGRLSGFKLRPDEDGPHGFVLGFSLDNTNSSAADKYQGVLGASLFERQFLTSTEDDGFPTFGLLATASTDSDLETGLFGGPAQFLDDDGNSSNDNALITARDFSTTGFKTDFDSSTDGDSLFRSEVAVSSLSDTSLSEVKFGSWDSPTNGFFQEHSQTSDGGISASNAGADAYWFIADPGENLQAPAETTISWSDTGSGSTHITNIQGGGETKNGSQVNAYALAGIDNQSFELNLNLNNGTYNGSFTLETTENIQWIFDFSGEGLSNNPVFLDLDLAGNPGDGDYLYDASASESDSLSDGNSTLSGNVSGFFVGDGSREGLVLGFALAASNVSLSDSERSTKVSRSLAGTLLLDNGCENQACAAGLSLPESTTETYNIGWGQWDNPVEQNFGVTVVEAGQSVEIQTSDYLAEVNPTPVANLVGTASYASTIASDFIGSGSAGDVTQVVAGMDVDFNSGLISNGSLQVEVGGSQAWDIDFAGTVAGGAVDLQATAGSLMNPAGLISDSIQADLGGVFTGIHAEAFVGGFELIDQMDALNHVNGLYTIEK